MLLKSSAVLENIDDTNLSKELEIAKFRNYGRQHFSDLIQYDISLENYIENSSIFYSVSLPNELSDFFLRIDLAPYFILSDAPVLNEVEKLLQMKKNEYDFVSNFREIKNYYYKWIIQKTNKDKLYYSNSIINTVERNFEFQSFYSVLIYGIVLSFDPVNYNPKKAIQLFDRAKEIVAECKVPDSIRTGILYYISLFKGFLYLKEYEYSNSLRTFQEALTYNANGVTAFFYSALSARYLDDFDTAYDYLREVIEHDKLRFNYAINFNHLDLMKFFYKNASFYYVFTENGFAQLLPDIDFLIRSHYSSEMNSMQKTYSKLINLDNLRIKEFYDDSVYREIKFLKNALDYFRQKRNGLIRIVEQIFRDKLITLIEYIRNLIETHYFNQIKEEIVVYDRQIEQNQRQLQRIKHEMEDATKKIKMNLDEAAGYLEETLTEKSRALEKKIESMDADPRFNPSNVFYSSILFTILIALVVFIVVGVITSITGFGEQMPSAQLAVKVGLRWGGITLAVGVFISVFTALSSFWEKASEKKYLNDQLKKIKHIEDEERKLLHEDSDHKAKMYELKFKERIQMQEKIIEDFIQERKQNYERKYNDAKKEINQYIEPLNKLIESLHVDG